MSWKRFEDRKPKKGTHILALGDGVLWWGFYNNATEDGKPPFAPIYWAKMDPFPRMPTKEEVAPFVEEVVESEEKLEDSNGQTHQERQEENR